MNKFKMTYELAPHGIGKDFWVSKEALYKAFFGAFYDFIHERDPHVLIEHSLMKKEDFLAFCQDWSAEGKDSLYAMGFAFYPYYLRPTESLSIEDQYEEHFIGWCWQHDRFRAFITFLINYFAYWRNDEGCTSFDPYNHADRFFASSWAALVDTGKLFYFTSETVYSWHSFRIKYILDHIPGVALAPIELPEELEEGESLPVLSIAGFSFRGWFESAEATEPVKLATKPMTLYARFEPHDRYDYWEREEKKIKKVIVEPYKKCDPA